MISKREKKRIKTELSKGEKGYCETILDYLKANQIFNAKGEPFSESMIYVMFSQQISHARLEHAIFDCYVHHKKLNDAEKLRRKQILQSV